VSDTDVADAPSGFPPISRDVALMLNVFKRLHLTLETIIQAVKEHDRRLRADSRERGFEAFAWAQHPRITFKRSIVTMFRIFIVYQPLRFSLTVSLFPLLAGHRDRWALFVVRRARQQQRAVESLILAACYCRPAF